MGRNISTHRFRNNRWYLVCQSRGQVESAYLRESGTIISNCKNIYFMGSPEIELMEELPERAGYTNISEDGTPKRLISVGDLRKIKKGWEYSEVYYTSGAITCVSILPDIDQYDFLNEFTECEPLPFYQYKELEIYSSEDMLRDIYSMNYAFHKKAAGSQILLESEQIMAERYAKLFQDN